MFLIFIFIIGLGFSGIVFAHQYHSRDKAIYGQKFMGENIGGLDRRGVLEKINQKISEIEVRFVIDGSFVSYSPEKIGVTFKKDQMLEEVETLNVKKPRLESYLDSAKSLIYQIDEIYFSKMPQYFLSEIPIKYQIDENQLQKFTSGLSKKYNVEEKNAGLVMNGTEIKVIPAIYGRQLIIGAVRSQVESALNEGKDATIDVNVEEINPKILEQDTQDAIEKAQVLLNKKITFTYREKEYSPTKDIVASWIVFREEDGILRPSFNSEKIKPYLNKISKEIYIAPVNQKVKIVNGENRQITREGKNGLAVNVSLLANETAKILSTSDNVKKVIPTYTVKYKTEVNNVLVANWDKYIEINISTQTMCAYLKGGEKVNCWKVTTGASGWSTPTGTFLIRRKSGAGGTADLYGRGGGVCMPNPPNPPPNDKLCGINYVSTFTAQGHAIHEAWWRRYPGDANYFGNPNYRYNGSHGCVNATYDVAKFIYYWAPIGTPIVIHY